MLLSFHNLGGVIIANTTVADNPSILLPVQDGPVATCRHQDVWFVCVNCMVNFAVIILIPNYSMSILRVGFYVKLPQTTRVVVDGVSTNYNLTTWLGASNLDTLTPAQVCAEILETCFHDGPVTLHTTNFNLTTSKLTMC